MSQKNPAERAAYWAKYYAENKDRLIKAASVRQAAKDAANPEAKRERCRRERQLNPEHVRNRAKKSRIKIKVLAIQAYGGQCACCGEKELEFLSIDHINGGGRQHKKTIGGGSGDLYRFVRLNGFPPGFQVLCLNCNLSKHIGGGVCAHKRTQTQSSDAAGYGFI